MRLLLALLISVAAAASASAQSEDGVIVVDASRAANGRYILIIDKTDNGVRVTRAKGRTVNLGDPDDPLPNPPDDPDDPGPDPSDLAEQVATWASEVDVSNNEILATASGYETVAKQIEAGKFEGDRWNRDIVEAQDEINALVWGDRAAEWETFQDQLMEALGAMEQSGGLRSREAYIVAWRQIASGLRSTGMGALVGGGDE